MLESVRRRSRASLFGLWALTIYGVSFPTAVAAPPAASNHDAAQGQLVIKVPQLFAGRYWLYVDGALVRVGRIKECSLRKAVQVSTPEGVVFMGEQGVLVRVLDGRIRYVRPQVESNLHFERYNGPVRPGSHKVELALRSVDVGDEAKRSNEGAFTFWSQRIDLSAGETATVEFAPWIQEGAGEGNRAVRAWLPTTDAAEIRRRNQLVQTGMRRFESNPLVLALRDAEGAPRVGSRIALDLPEKLGGSREYDAQQIRAMAAWLKQYGAGMDYDGPPVAEAQRIAESFHRIAGRMERAMAEEISELVEVIAAPLEPLPPEP